ncbi:hypothetical protein [Rhizobium leguminosarum]|uniref:hypothetical protein n=1 Tax=Rhizobium leguminosarum TaxID=384 RepID=UPI003F9821A2
MNLQTFEGLRAFFVPNLAEGDPGARSQADALKDLLEYIRRGLSPSLAPDSASKFLKWAESQVEIVAATDQSIPSSRLRFVDDQKLKKFISTPDNGAFYIDAIAAFLCEFQGFDVPKFQIESEREKLARAIVTYTALGAVGSINRAWGPEELASLRTQMEAAVRSAQFRLQQVSDELIGKQKLDADLREMLLVRVTDAGTTLHSLQEQFAQSNSVILGAEQKAVDFRDKIEPIEKNFSAFSAAIEARFQISATKKLWQERAFSSGISFYVSTALLLILLIVPAVMVATNYNAISHAVQAAVLMPKDPNAPTNDGSQRAQPNAPAAVPLNSVELIAVTLNRAVLLIFPIALYVWLIRLLVRYNSRSMLLMDDARIRQAMMDTFYRLATDQTLKDDERKLMLEALYRPAPGHTDGPDFPNVIELVNKIPK